MNKVRKFTLCCYVNNLSQLELWVSGRPGTGSNNWRCLWMQLKMQSLKTESCMWEFRRLLHLKEENESSSHQRFSTSVSGMKVDLTPKRGRTFEKLSSQILYLAPWTPRPPPLTWCCCSRKSRCWVGWERTRTKDNNFIIHEARTVKGGSGGVGHHFTHAWAPAGLSPPHLPLRKLSLTLHSSPTLIINTGLWRWAVVLKRGLFSTFNAWQRGSTARVQTREHPAVKHHDCINSL